MNLIKQFLFQPLLGFMTRKNIVAQPKVINFNEKHCIGYKITTSFTGNQQKKDIPPFFHNIYDDDDKLKALKQGNGMNMYCIFDVHKNGKDFDYYVATESTTESGNLTLAG